MVRVTTLPIDGDCSILIRSDALKRTRHRNLRQDVAPFEKTTTVNDSTVKRKSHEKAPRSGKVSMHRRLLHPPTRAIDTSSSSTKVREDVENREPSAVQQVFGNIEIVSNILLHLDPISVVGIKRVSIIFQNAVWESPVLRAYSCEAPGLLLVGPDYCKFIDCIWGEPMVFRSQAGGPIGDRIFGVPLPGCPRFVYGLRRDAQTSRLFGELVCRVDSRQDAFVLGDPARRYWKEFPLSHPNYKVEVVVEYGLAQRQGHKTSLCAEDAAESSYEYCLA
ncbi:hypothetical protein M409DRAFT_22249 [Zasmidium cellare ATCC 36951]|uniref:F-box domain-containing protein n=1 Tax=Zasmidium cellare ATCC 36951 TaxID=1080233 RepID=A0A6A6CK71_ZASCE|nr:uncharacterized protein M409DRAFT_22249 [Zasmidium cellare ATCC 36951]KAF2167441.1 hypothetical protein M409DRAFT_22249 [Zasmidium cellare ATCC 36951]